MEEWREYYLDVILVPLGLLITIAYHVWLWHKVRTQPSSTVIGINAHGRRFWVPAMMKVRIPLSIKITLTKYYFIIFFFPP